MSRWVGKSAPTFGLLAALAACGAAAAPTILVTNLPAYGTTDNLAGLVAGADPAKCRVAVFIYVPGYWWVSKPTCAEALTTIQADGTWTADITTGGSDQLATRVAALLVSTNYNLDCVQGEQYLTNQWAQALASAVVTRPAPGVRTVSFSGYDWSVKAGAGLLGPGPNYFSDSTNNVWTDAGGRLHVRITNRSNQWQCAELVTTRTFGYGSYRFELESRVDNLNPSVVLGLFTWSDDPAYTHREIDVECSRFGMPTDFNNSQFVIQPYSTPGHLVRYAVPTGLTNSTHLYKWESNRVSFQALRGSYTAAPPATNVMASWIYALTVPQTGDENVRINLWLFSGAPPTDGHEVEVIIKSFRFVPLGSAAGATLTNVQATASGTAQFSLLTVPDFRYEVQAGTDLSNWQTLATLLATNFLMPFVETGAMAWPRRFYRGVTLE